MHHIILTDVEEEVTSSDDTNDDGSGGRICLRLCHDTQQVDDTHTTLPFTLTHTIEP